MVIDTSALVAILQSEEGADRLLAATQTRALLVNAREDGTEIRLTELPAARASTKDRN